MTISISSLTTTVTPRFATAAALLLSGFLASCSKDADSVSPALPTTVTFTQAGLFPEGVQYDSKNTCFLVSSVSTGNVGRVTDDGTYTLLSGGTTSGGTRLITSSLGLSLDDSRNRVLVASANLTTGAVARLVSLNRDNGQVNFNTDLGVLRPAAGHLANDVAVDAQGNAYVTDSYAPVIYKVDPQGVATVFLDNPAFSAPANAFGLNGIVYHPDGYLLVAKTDNGTLFKIPLTAPASFTTVATTGLDLTGADGLLLQDNTTLQVVAAGRVQRLTTANSWAAATSSGTFVAAQSTSPTTLARRDGAASYVVYSRFSELTATPTPTSFVIGKVSF
jgi:sugar lactone lactonase YvrE